jgi:hypothetical protein
MELPADYLGPRHDSQLPSDHQTRLRQAGWQVLATLSTQFDHRCCTEHFLPTESLYFRAVQAGEIGLALKRCGMGAADKSLQLDASSWFILLTEPTLLNPAMSRLLGALSQRRATRPTFLPPFLALVTSRPLGAVATAGSS